MKKIFIFKLNSFYNMSFILSGVLFCFKESLRLFKYIILVFIFVYTLLIINDYLDLFPLKKSSIDQFICEIKFTFYKKVFSAIKQSVIL